MPGFDNGVMFANNVDFTGSSVSSGSAQVTTNGQILIGSSVAPNIRVGTLGSSDSSITWTTGNGTITGQVTGGSTVGKTVTASSGGALSPSSGNWNFVGSGGVTTSGSGNTITISASAGNTFGPVLQTGTQVASSLTTVAIPYFAGNPTGSFVSTINVSNTAMYLVPIYIDQAKTYTAFGCKVTNVPGVGSTIDYVLYNSDGTGGLPGTLAASSVNVNTSAAGINEGSFSAALSVGYYWIGVQRNATATVTIQAVANGDAFSFLTNRAFINLSNLTSGTFSMFNFFGFNNTYGTYNSNPTVTQNQPANAVPVIYIR